tara:strand:+ start:997 stop:1539 length:543 start_codon:yes stop_codon:yes gene_type:complete
MLEALIRTKNSACADKRGGDVICVKLKEFADWGAMEQRVHMVLDWDDESLEESMRQQLGKTKSPPTVVTPYKEVENCTIFDNNGIKIYEGDVTKTRSKKYFNIELGEAKEKTDEEVSQEFESNKEFAKTECLKTKPGPPVGDETPIHNNQKYLDYLDTLSEQLSRYGIKTEIIDGKLVRV